MDAKERGDSVTMWPSLKSAIPNSSPAPIVSLQMYYLTFIFIKNEIHPHPIVVVCSEITGVEAWPFFLRTK